jgi:hypothetical protein
MVAGDPIRSRHVPFGAQVPHSGPRGRGGGVAGEAGAVRPEPFRGSLAVAAGEVARGVLRSARFTRVFPDVYVPADVEIDHRVRSLAALVLVGEGGVLAGYSAATVLGAPCAPRSAPAEVLVDAHVRSHPGLRVRRGTAVGADRWTVRGRAVTAPARTAWDLARRLELAEAVVALDALAARGGFAPDELLRRRAAAPGARGCRRLDRVVQLADPRAESPMESRLRLLLVLAGLPVPQVQYRLVADGRTVARFDLAYPAAQLAIEYDGGAHVDELDRRRDIRTGRLGWYTARFTAPDLADPAATSAAVRALLAQRLPLFGRTERDLRAPGA